MAAKRSSPAQLVMEPGWGLCECPSRVLPSPQSPSGARLPASWKPSEHSQPGLPSGSSGQPLVPDFPVNPPMESRCASYFCFLQAISMPAMVRFASLTDPHGFVTNQQDNIPINAR